MSYDFYAGVICLPSTISFWTNNNKPKRETVMTMMVLRANVIGCIA